MENYFFTQNKNSEKENLNLINLISAQKISLRKQIMTKSRLSSRLKSIKNVTYEESFYQINLDKLNLNNNENIIKFNSSSNEIEKLNILFNLLIQNDINLIKFSIFHIRNILNDFDVKRAKILNLNKIITNDAINYFFKLLYENLNDKQMIYEICYVIILLIYLEVFDLNIFINNSQKIFNLSQKFKDPILIKKLIWILGLISNFLYNDEINKFLDSLQNFYLFIINSIEELENLNNFQVNNANIDLICIEIWIYGIFYNNKYYKIKNLIEDENRCAKHIKIISQFCKKNIYNNLYSESLDTICYIINEINNNYLKILNENDNLQKKYKTIFKSCGFIENLIPNLNNFSEIEEPKNVINILIFISYLSDKSMLKMIDYDICENIEKLLFTINSRESLNECKRLIIMILDLINNFTIKYKYINPFVRQTDCFNYLFNIINKTGNLNQRLNLLEIFDNIFELNNKKLITELVMGNLPEFYVECLKINESSKTNLIIELTLKGIGKLLNYGDEFNKNTLNDNNNVIKVNLLENTFETLNINYLLEKISLSKNSQKNSEIANYLLEKYFSHNNNKNDNNNI